jgi:hypothetical protein
MNAENSAMVQTFSYQLYNVQGELFHPKSRTWDHIEIIEEITEAKPAIELKTSVI